MKWCFSFSFVLFLSVCAPLYPHHTPFVLVDTLQEHSIHASCLGILEDPTLQITIDEVSGEAKRNQFVEPTKELLVNEKSQTAYWLSFTICNSSTDPKKKWVMEFFDHHISEIEFYTPLKEGGFSKTVSGNAHPFTDRLFAHKNMEFDFYVPQGECSTFYFRIFSENKNVIVPVVRTIPVFVSYALSEYYLLGIFYGILLLMAFYNLLLFVAIGKRFYLYYTCYVIAVMLFTMCQNGLAFAFLWPKRPSFNLFSLELTVYGSVLFLVLFTKSFLNVSLRLPRLNKWIKGVLLARAALMLLGWFFFPKILRYTFLDLVPLVVAYAAMWASYRYDKGTSRYFVLTYSLVCITFLITILEQYGFVTSSIFTVYSMNIGIVVEIILLSTSLARQMSNEIKQKEKAQSGLILEIKEKELLTQKVNRDLEQLVKQRTEELDIANAKLKQQVQDTTTMNQKLDLLNWNLKQNVSEIAEKRIVKPIADYKEFLEVYSNESACYRFIAKLKSKVPFQCVKCGAEHHGKGKAVFDKRCTKCGYNESITANTLFHKLKFPVEKAFYMTHLIFNRPSVRAEELSQWVDLRKETCSAFKRKVLERMQALDKKELRSWDVLVLNQRFDKQMAKEKIK